jgi:hypothetical protein
MLSSLLNIGIEGGGMEDIKNHWNTVVIKISTFGGYVTEKGREKILQVPNIKKGDQLTRYYDFLEFKVTASQLEKLFTEARQLKAEIMIAELDDSKKKKAATPRKAKKTTRTKKATTATKNV